MGWQAECSPARSFTPFFDGHAPAISMLCAAFAAAAITIKAADDL
jgi:hypothetical protein